MYLWFVNKFAVANFILQFFVVSVIPPFDDVNKGEGVVHCWLIIKFLSLEEVK